MNEWVKANMYPSLVGKAGQMPRSQYQRPSGTGEKLPEAHLYTGADGRNRPTCPPLTALSIVQAGCQPAAPLNQQENPQPSTQPVGKQGPFAHPLLAAHALSTGSPCF